MPAWMQLEMDRSFTSRSVNEGFSGGEKKRNEILQLMMLEPKYAVLDETDSGLDIDALKIVSRGVNAMRSEDRGFLVITHYQRLLDYIQPDIVHVLKDGRIVKTGGKELALELEERGYDWLKEEEQSPASSTSMLPGLAHETANSLVNRSNDPMVIENTATVPQASTVIRHATAETSPFPKRNKYARAFSSGYGTHARPRPWTLTSAM
jgi:ABC-type multidrug transport system ATPase subunit